MRKAVERPYTYEVLDDESAAIPVYCKGQWFVTIVDLEDAEYLAQFYWSLSPSGYVTSTINRQTTRMHRLILGLDKNDTRVVDHINQLRAYNKKSNLRIVTQYENMSNASMFKNNTSGYRGVAFHKKSNKWHAYARNNDTKQYLGIYDTAEEAARAYDRFVIANRDEIAKTNFDRSEYK